MYCFVVHFPSWRETEQKENKDSTENWQLHRIPLLVVTKNKFLQIFDKSCFVCFYRVHVNCNYVHFCTAKYHLLHMNLIKEVCKTKQKKSERENKQNFIFPLMDTVCAHMKCIYIVFCFKFYVFRLFFPKTGLLYYLEQLNLTQFLLSCYIAMQNIFRL